VEAVVNDSMNNSIEPNNKETVGQQKLKILLLYARENGDFQNAVHKFREDLKETLGPDCEVRNFTRNSTFTT
jgi:hypothetical protein